MNLGQLTSKAKALVEKRGGTDSLKQDAEELKKIASGSGSVGDKAKAAAAAVKDPGADESPAPTQAAEQYVATPETPERQGRGGDDATRRRAGRRRRR